ncbi:MAG: cupin domain-containing protein [Opitutaceae bacterium]
MATPHNPFPTPITELPRVALPIAGAEAFLAQGDAHQVLFMRFGEAVAVAPHAHEAQWGVVVAGSIELTVGGETKMYGPGESYFIPAGVVHSARIAAGYADVTFFASPTRYRVAGTP